METNDEGPHMIDISSKPIIQREASAIGKIRLKKKTICLINQGKIEKGDPITVAKVAGIMAAKNTSAIVPLCHPISITNVEVATEIFEDEIVLRATVKAMAKTGVEMEALTALTTALLTVWDMVKQYEKDEDGQYPSTTIKDIRVLQKIKGDKNEQSCIR